MKKTHRMVISFQPEWNGPFKCSRKNIVHSASAGMDEFNLTGIKWPILAGMQWSIPFQPEWNDLFIPARMKWCIPIRLEWNSLFHSGRNEMVHFISAVMDWLLLVRVKWTVSFWPEWNVHSVDVNKKYASCSFICLVPSPRRGNRALGSYYWQTTNLQG